MNKKIKSNIKKVLLVIVGLLTLGAIASLFTNLATREENEIHPTFVLGGLDANGKYVESKDTLFTPDAIEYNELSIELDFKSDMKYKLYFYDENDAFVSTSDLTDAKYEETTTSLKYVRVVLKPTFDKDVKAEDRKITALQKIKLVNQVTICAKVNETEEVEMITFSVTSVNGEIYNFTSENGLSFGDLPFENEKYYSVDSNDVYLYIDSSDIVYIHTSIGDSSIALNSMIIENNKTYTHYEPIVETIIFYVVFSDDVTSTYTAIPGMTWEEWVNSTYYKGIPLAYNVELGIVHYHGDTNRVLANFSDVIEDGKTYTFVSNS